MNLFYKRSYFFGFKTHTAAKLGNGYYLVFLSIELAFDIEDTLAALPFTFTNEGLNVFRTTTYSFHGVVFVLAFYSGYSHLIIGFE